MSFIAPSLDAFKAKFTLQLQNMLNPHSEHSGDGCGLGAFILVLANSMQDKTLFDTLQPILKEHFLALEKTIANNTNAIDFPIDDKQVFERIAQYGLAYFNCWQTKQITPWQLTYNPLRALRPARASQQKLTHIYQAFDTNKFHFNKPFLRPEILSEDTWHGVKMRVLYNKFPFTPWHLLLAPEPEQQHPQFLSMNMHQHMAHLINHCQHLPDFGIAYNSLGAYASVNQLHFQGFIRPALPIENSCWQHNGGEHAYPIACQRYQDPIQAWEYIEALHQQNQPYNLLYRPEACYVIPQQGQLSDVTPSAWVHGAGWHEMCGVFTVTDNDDFIQLKAQTIEQELTKFTLPRDY